MKNLYEFCGMAGTTTTFKAILKDPTVKDGVVSAIQVAELSDLSEGGKFSYRKCDEKSFVAGGGPFTLVEYTGVIEE